MDETQVYRETLATAHQNGELKQYWESKRYNKDCAKAIDQAISNSNYELYYYDLKTAAQRAVSQYGLDRVSWVLAHIVQQHEYDGRYSQVHKQWAGGFSLPNKDMEFYVLNAHPTVVDGFIHRVVELENSLKRIAKHIVQEGTQNTTQGNWIIGFDEFPPELGGADFIETHQRDILHLLEQTEEVADAVLLDSGFDVGYHLDYCPNAEQREQDEPGSMELEQDTPDKLARDYHVLMEDYDPYGYRDLYEFGHLNVREVSMFEVDSVKKAIKPDAKAIEKGGRDFENIKESIAQLTLDDSGDRQLMETAKKAQALIYRLNSYAQNHHRQRKKSVPDSTHKPSLLSQLEEGKKAAVHRADPPRAVPKRDSGREV